MRRFDRHSDRAGVVGPRPTFGARRAARRSAPQRRAAQHPPATLRETQGAPIDVRVAIGPFESYPSRTARHGFALSTVFERRAEMAPL